MGDHRINLQNKNGKAKPYQEKQALAAIDRSKERRSSTSRRHQNMPWPRRTHAKNASVLEGQHGWVVAPVYDIPCTLVYGVDTMALTRRRQGEEPQGQALAGFRCQHRAAGKSCYSSERGSPEAAAAIDLKTLPFTGSPLNGAPRELRSRRAELTG